MGTYVRSPVEFMRGEGTRLWDAEGNEYLDFLSGLAVVQIGHCHPALVEAVREQAERLVHVGNFFYTEPAMRLAKRLADGSLGGKVFLCNSGAEAIECALKLARRHRPAGRVPHALLLEVFTKEGIGTMVAPGPHPRARS